MTAETQPLLLVCYLSGSETSACTRKFAAESHETVETDSAAVSCVVVTHQTFVDGRT